MASLPPTRRTPACSGTRHTSHGKIVKGLCAQEVRGATAAGAGSGAPRLPTTIRTRPHRSTSYSSIKDDPRTGHPDPDETDSGVGSPAAPRVARRRRQVAETMTMRPVPRLTSAWRGWGPALTVHVVTMLNVVRMISGTTFWASPSKCSTALAYSL